MELKANLIKVQVNIVLVLGKVKGVVVLDGERDHGRAVVNALASGNLWSMSLTAGGNF